MDFRDHLISTMRNEDLISASDLVKKTLVPEFNRILEAGYGVKKCSKELSVVGAKFAGALHQLLRDEEIRQVDMHLFHGEESTKQSFYLLGTTELVVQFLQVP